MRHLVSIIAVVMLAAAALPAAETMFVPSKLTPPPPVREFRGAWIATVANIDWPSKPGLPAAQQKAELINLLDRAAQLKFNAILLQVRPVADAIYPSPFEPWSEYLTGVQGKRPQPMYDPLAFAIAEAHRRGMELHAWFNPYRAWHIQAKSAPASNHVTQTHPELVRHYGSQTILDPGEPESQTRALNAVLDVVKRYDIDGVVFDDYFYPYPEKNGAGNLMDFPDAASWKKYGASSGLSRDDWRRANVNQFVQKISQSIKAIKPWVQFGISPFGIWRPGVPAGINPKALDAYGKLYADARLWLANGWVDYLAPQLYWPIAQRDLSFPVLLKWWEQQNLKHRNVYAGLYDAKFSADEISRQLQIIRSQPEESGAIHYHLRSITDNASLAAAIRKEYAQPALVPAAPWLDSRPPGKPRLTVVAAADSAVARWKPEGTEPVGQWLLQVRTKGEWTTEIFPASQTSQYFSNSKFDVVSLRAVNRVGNLSAPTVLSVVKYAASDGHRGNH